MHKKKIEQTHDVNSAVVCHVARHTRLRFRCGACRAHTTIKVSVWRFVPCANGTLDRQTWRNRWNGGRPYHKPFGQTLLTHGNHAFVHCPFRVCVELSGAKNQKNPTLQPPHLLEKTQSTKEAALRTIHQRKPQ